MEKVRILLTSWILSVFLGAFCTASHAAPRYAEHVPGEMIVKLREAQFSVQASSILTQTLQNSLGAGTVQEVRPLDTDASLVVVRLKNDSLLASAISTLQNESLVAYSEPNYIYHTMALPGDPNFFRSWSMNNTGQNDSKGRAGTVGSDIQVMPLWNQGITGSHDIVVGVIDTGIDLDHPDLQDNIYKNPGEIPGNKIDDDKNGFVDDVHGWNFSAKNNNPDDDNDHGTHCAGVIGAKGGNSVGTAGINWNIKLMPLKFLNASGRGSVDRAIDAINYATKMGVKILSNSWGGGAYSASLHDSILRAQENGVLFIAAAGNDASDNDRKPAYPASFKLPNVISVAAIDNQDALGSFSNYGARTVHVAAPGVNVYSTVKNGNYNSFSGTSMAAPHVAGIAALLLSRNPGWTYEVLKDRIIRGSTPITGLRRKILAGGRVNATNSYNGNFPPSGLPKESDWISKSQVIESPHPYKDRAKLSFPIKIEGAKFIRVRFERISSEERQDLVTIETPDGAVIQSFSGNHSGVVSESIEGDALVVKFTSNASRSGWGFKIDQVQYVPR